MLALTSVAQMRRTIDRISQEILVCLRFLWKRCLKLIACADCLQFPTVRDACCDFLAKRLHPSNCINIRDFAENMSCTKLVDLALTFIAKNIVAVSDYHDFLALPYNVMRQVWFRSKNGTLLNLTRIHVQLRKIVFWKCAVFQNVTAQSARVSCKNSNFCFCCQQAMIDKYQRSTTWYLDFSDVIRKLRTA